MISLSKMIFSIWLIIIISIGLIYKFGMQQCMDIDFIKEKTNKCYPGRFVDLIFNSTIWVLILLKIFA